MKYAIIGSGEIDTALARAFAQKNIEVAIANTRGPATLASLTKELGPGVSPRFVQDAAQAEMIFLAVPFPAHRDVARQLPRWDGKIIVDSMNTLDLSLKQREELGGALSSEVVSEACVGAPGQGLRSPAGGAAWHQPAGGRSAAGRVRLER